MASLFKWKKPFGLYIICLIIATGVLYYCTCSSPAYILNNWTDANMFLTIAKGINSGMVYFRDLYDQKGPFLFLLYQIPALISSSSFIGVFILEVIMASLFLFSSYYCIRKLGAGKLTIITLPIIAMCVYSSYCLLAGGTIEELLLPIFSFVIYDIIVFFKENKTPSLWRLILHGFLMGCVFWAKYTLIALQISYFIALFFIPLFQKKYKEAFARFGWLFLGFTLATLPWIIYFWANNALDDMFKHYFYDNIFNYAVKRDFITTLRFYKRFLLEWLNNNWLWSYFFGLGIIFSLFIKKLRYFIPLTVAFMIFSLFAGGIVHPYTYLPFVVFLPFFFANVVKGIEYICKKIDPLLSDNYFIRSNFFKGVKIALFFLLIFVCVKASYYLSPNTKNEYYGKTLEEIPHYEYIEIMSKYENPSVLTCAVMDFGFYTLLDILPTQKYYCGTNNRTSESYAEQLRYINEGLCDFVFLPSWFKAPNITDHYTLVLTSYAEPYPSYYGEPFELYQKTSMLKK